MASNCPSLFQVQSHRASNTEKTPFLTRKTRLWCMGGVALLSQASKRERRIEDSAIRRPCVLVGHAPIASLRGTDPREYFQFVVPRSSCPSRVFSAPGPCVEATPSQAASSICPYVASTSEKRSPARLVHLGKTHQKPGSLAGEVDAC